MAAKAKAIKPVTEEQVEEAVEVVEEVKATKKRTATVTAKLLNVRTKDSASSSVITTVAEGTVLEVKSSNSDWTEVVTPDGGTGFVMSQFVMVK